jgi:hypothetical protein
VGAEMSSGQGITNVNQVLRMHADEARDWLDAVRNGRESARSDFNWLLLAEVAGSRAERGLGPGRSVPDENLKWAGISVSTYEWLADGEREQADSFLVSAMMLRAYMIVHSGARQGDPVLDPAVITDWFWNNVHISPKEAVDKSVAWMSRLNSTSPEEARHIDPTEILELRRVKHRLRVIDFLVERGALIPDRGLRSWLDARRSLI